MRGGLRTKNIKKQSSSGEPLVSVITVVLNGRAHLAETIRSIRGQTYKNVEYIICDGGSTDGTLEILKQNEDVIDLWVSEKDGGIFYAMNKGISLATGEIIGILNADDHYYPETIRHVVEADRYAGADIYYGDMALLTDREPVRMRPDIHQMDQKPAIFHPTCFVKKHVYEKAGAFDTRFRISSDYEFLLRCIRKGFRFQYVPEVLTAFRPGGMSGSCASNVEGYHIMKMHRTGYHRQVIVRAVKCYVKSFLKKLINLKKR
jgi:glycosyltransferase involved in cell wall biosynthesis